MLVERDEVEDWSLFFFFSGEMEFSRVAQVTRFNLQGVSSSGTATTLGNHLSLSTGTGIHRTSCMVTLDVFNPSI